MHGSSLEGIVLYGALSQIVLSLINVFARVCTALLYRLVRILFICLFLQHESRWRHVSFWREGRYYIVGICLA